MNFMNINEDTIQLICEHINELTGEKIATLISDITGWIFGELSGQFISEKN